MKCRSTSLSTSGSPPPRYTAAMTASMASASSEARSLPPVRCSPRPSSKQLAQAQRARHAGEPLLVDDEGAALGELALVRVGEALHQPVAHGQVDDGVPQELQALVVGEPLVAVLVDVALVGERGVAQLGAGEAQLQPLLQGLHPLGGAELLGGAHAHSASWRASSSASA